MMNDFEGKIEAEHGSDVPHPDETMAAARNNAKSVMKDMSHDEVANAQNTKKYSYHFHDGTESTPAENSLQYSEKKSVSQMKNEATGSNVNRFVAKDASEY